MGNAKTIVLKGLGMRKERMAVAAITPGHLVEVTSANKVQVHGTASGFAQKAFAVEDDLQGNTIADAYAAGDMVQYNVMNPGEEVNVLISDGENISIGDKLTSAGDGTLKAVSSETGDETTVCIALEAVDMSGSSAADPSGRCAAEVV